MSWKPETKVFGDQKFYQNGLVFSTEDEAKRWGQDLLDRWTQAETSRVVEVTDEPNYVYTEDRKLIAIEKLQEG
jgi:hypothetical protein